MDIIDFPIERINEFLRDHEFLVKNPWGLSTSSTTLFGDTTIKVKLTGITRMISIGEWKNFVEYTIYIENIEDDNVRRLNDYLFISLKTNDYLISNQDTQFYSLTSQINELLRNFFKYWDIDYYVTCTRIINNVVHEDPKSMVEGVITEGKQDRAIRTVVKDIIQTFKYQKEGHYTLPEDITLDDQEMVYDFPNLKAPFNVELSMYFDDEVDTVDVDCEYYRDDDTIVVRIKSNPKLDRETLEELHFELNELVAHELKHLEQKYNGYKFPKKEPKKALKYYSQPHEIEAQIAGFKRRSQKERKPFVNVVYDWFDKNYIKHGLNDKEIEIVVNKILDNF